MYEMQYHQQPQFDPDDPISNLLKGIKRLFESTQSPISDNSQSVSTIPILDVSYLTYSEQRIVDNVSIRKLLTELRDLASQQSVSCDIAFHRLFVLLPEMMIEEFTNAMDVYDANQYHIFSSDDTYEEIMRKFMGFAAETNSVPWCINDLVSGSFKMFDVVVKVINRFSHQSIDTIELDIFPIRPAVLTLLWALLLMELVKKYTGSCINAERKIIAKMVISITFSIVAGFTGYMHTGGYGIASPTKYMKTYYNVQKYIETEYPYSYSKMPNWLKFSSCTAFDNLVQSQQISTAKGLNMAYTFRVGDSLLENLSSGSIISESVMKRAFTSIWPLPLEYEAKKMYKLYTNNKIYYL